MLKVEENTQIYCIVDTLFIVHGQAELFLSAEMFYYLQKLKLEL